jgi:hypothetical protein
MMNPRIEHLHALVAGLPVDEKYREALYRSIDLYADQLINRLQGDGLDDLEALQQVTLGDMMEMALRRE